MCYTFTDSSHQGHCKNKIGGIKKEEVGRWVHTFNLSNWEADVGGSL